MAKESTHDDSNRIVAVVTGANGGLGYAICQVLLRCLSQHPEESVYETTPMVSSLHPTLAHLAESIGSTSAAPGNEYIGPSAEDHASSRGQTLTLVLVCRTLAKGKQVRKDLLSEHDELLLDRAREGREMRNGWRDGLRIELETCDLSTPGGENGLLALSQRLRQTLPYITLLFLNAAHAQLLGNDYWLLTKQVLTEGPIDAFTRPYFMREASGILSKDGERGMVWTTNVLSTYILANELGPLLRQSPKRLAYRPRVIHTSSRTAERRALPPDILVDPQMTHAAKTYAASKYLATLLIAHMDKILGSANNDTPVRCLNVDPGAVRTNVMDQGFHAEGAGFAMYVAVMRWGYWLAFLFCKYVLGSTWHPGSPDNSSLAMVYASLLDDRYLAGPGIAPGPVFQIWARRWLKPSVAIRSVDEIEKSLAVTESQVKECERVWSIWKEREKTPARDA